MRKSKKKLSVVMATYNGEKFITEQVLSILNQTYKVDEIIIVDDASTDSTVHLLSQFSKKYYQFNIKIIQNTINQGINKSFEIAFQSSMGDFIFISDQDDVWEKNKVEVMVDKWNGSLLTCSDAKIVDSNLKTLYKSELFKTNSEIFTCDIHFLFANCFSGHNMMIKREMFIDIFPFPKHMLYDKWLALVAKNHSSLTIVNKSLCLHRMHNSNAQNNFSKNKRKNKKSLNTIINRKKLKIEELHSGLTNGASFLLSNKPNKNKILLGELILHGQRLDSMIFNFPLFLLLFKSRKKLFPSRSNFKQFRSIKNLCVGKRGFWLNF